MVFQSNGTIWGIKWATYGRDGQAQFDHALVTVPEKNQITTTVWQLAKLQWYQGNLKIYTGSEWQTN